MARKSAFKQLLEAASWRGRDATGVACVRINAPKEPAIVFKKAIKASDFTDLEQYRRLEHNFDEYGFVIGHARSSTSDGWNLADANAHPFQYGPVTLVHNGTIRNHKFLDSGIEHPVDSAHVAAALAKEEDPKVVLDKLLGPFALVWHDARRGTLNFAKNNDKPLFFCFVEKENTMFWGSELEAIYAILHRHDIKIDGKFRHCSAFRHAQFKVDDLRGFKCDPFGRRQTSAAQSGTTPYAAPWKEETRRLHQDRSYKTEQETTSTSQQEKSSTPHQMPTEDGECDTAEGVVVFRRGSLRPRSRRKIRAAKEKLLRLGRKIDYPICFTPEVWIPYKNQERGRRGAIRGKDRARNQWFEIGNVPKDVWDKANTAGRIYGRIVNVKRPTSFDVVVCDYDPELMERFVFRTTPIKNAAASEVAAASGPFLEEEDFKNRKYVGPGDVKLTEKEFNGLVKHGCGYCSRDLSVGDHEEILWVGPHQQTPICAVCAGNKDAQVQLGIASEVDRLD
jgi:hypothetical protein